jgi:hypothetical protein
MTILKQTQHTLPTRPKTNYPIRPKWDAILRDGYGNQISETKEEHQARYTAYLNAWQTFKQQWDIAAKENTSEYVRGVLSIIKNTK